MFLDIVELLSTGMPIYPPANAVAIQPIVSVSPPNPIDKTMERRGGD